MNGHVIRRVLLSVILGFGLGLDIYGQVVGHMPENLPRFPLVARFESGVLDQNSKVLLLQSWQGAIDQFDLSSKTLTRLGTNDGHGARLIPNGYLINTTNGLLQVEGSETIHLGEATLAQLDSGTRVLEGRFGVIWNPQGRVLRDFVARTNLLISTNNGFVDVSANGSVAFTDFEGETNTAIRWYHEGRFETVALLPRWPLPHVSTDGTNVLWSEPNPPFGSVYLLTPTKRIQLSTNTCVMEIGWPVPPQKKTSVAMKGGWIVFPRWETNNPGTLNNLWRRSPEGEITQLTTSPAFVLAMGDDGSVILDGTPGYISANGVVKDIGGGAPLARYFASGERFYVYSPLQSGGSGLFGVELETDPFGMFSWYDREQGKFVVSLLAGAAGTYVLERTEDFSDWSPVETVVVEGAFSREFGGTTPGFFRVRRQ